MKYLVNHKDKLVGCLLTAISISSFSQTSESADITNITRATFFSPGISYEARIGKFHSIVGNAFLATSIYFSYSSTFGTNSGIYFDLALALQYRYYYNYAKREAKGKRTAKNSLNYISTIAGTNFTTNRLSSSYLEEEERRPIYSIGIAWGFQRNYPKRFSLDLNLGVGYAYASNTKFDEFGQRVKVNAGRFTTIGDLSLGFWLNKK
jgi:hypothetical protein